MHFSLPLAVSTALLLAPAPAQSAADWSKQAMQPSEQQYAPNSYIVHFETRSFDLEALREASHAHRPVDVVEAIVRDLDLAVQRDQAGFVRAVEALGGKVTAQWWIINGAAIEGSPAVAEAVRKLPGVARVDRDPIYHITNDTSRNSQHHKATAANTRQVNGQPVVGTGVGVAVLDTGVDDNMNGTGRPHRGFFVNGDPNNSSGAGIGGSRLLATTGTSGLGTDDVHGHGTHVAGSVLNGWSSILGMAPNADLIGVKLSNNQGSAQGTWMVAAWQWVAANASRHRIKVANNSFSGSPDPNDGIQMALDSAAFNNDILITCSAGNSASNTTSSQNVWNGLAVGALTKSSLARAPFSAIGPLANFGRIYPDIAAVGVTVGSLATNDEANVAVSSGTSMSSPMVAGAAALVRQAAPNITARETKALLLNTARDIGQVRNEVGFGIINCDLAVERALAGDYRIERLSTANPIKNVTFTPTTSGAANVTIAFMHAPGGALPNVDLFVYDANNMLLASSTDTLISYERVSFSATAAQNYRVELRGISNLGSSLDVGVAGVGAGVRTPTLTAIAPNSTTSYLQAEVTLTGTDLGQIDRINIGATAITSFTIVSPTQVRFRPPSPFDIASHQVTAHNSAGTSNSMTLAILGVHPGVATSPPFVFRGTPVDQHWWTDRGWQVAIFLSIHNTPSSAPGIVNFGIGNNFSTLWYLTNVSCDNGGHGVKTWVFPTNTPPGIVYFQGIPFDSSNLQLPLEVSTINQMQIF